MSITEQLEAERRIINAATEGPWDHQEAFDASFVCAGDAEQSVSSSWVARIENRPGRTKDKADAEFIAHARAALPLRNAQVAKVLHECGEMEWWAQCCFDVGKDAEGKQWIRAAKAIRRAIEEAEG